MLLRPMLLLRHRFPVCSSGRQFEPKSSFGRLVGIRFSCTGTSRSCSPSEVCTPITSRCGVGYSGMPQKWNAGCALGSDRPTTVGGGAKPTSGSRATGSIYSGLSTPAVRRSTSFCRLNATHQRLSAFSPRLWAERTIRRRGSSTPRARRLSTSHRAAQSRGCSGGELPASTDPISQQRCGPEHRAIKRRIRASQHFRSFWGAWRTIAGYEAIHMIRKGQAYEARRRRRAVYSIASFLVCSAR